MAIRSKAWISLLLALAVTFSARAEEAASEGEAVLTLDIDNFDDTVAKHPFTAQVQVVVLLAYLGYLAAVGAILLRKLVAGAVLPDSSCLLHFTPQPVEIAADLHARPEPPVGGGVTTGALLFLVDLIRRC